MSLTASLFASSRAFARRVSNCADSLLELALLHIRNLMLENKQIRLTRPA